MGFDTKHDFTPPTILLGLLLCPWMWGIFLWWVPTASLYAQYIMRNAGLEETQAGIKIARRNSNNLRYADDTTLMAEN